MELRTYSLYYLVSSKNLLGKLFTYDGTKATCSLKPSQCLKTFVFIVSMIWQERAKRRVGTSVTYKIENLYLTHQLKKSDNVEEDCLEGICQSILFHQTLLA